MDRGLGSQRPADAGAPRDADPDRRCGACFDPGAPGGEPDLPLILVGYKGRRLEVCALPPHLTVRIGQAVVVEVDRGIDVGRVVRLGCGAGRPRADRAPHSVLRLASAEEIARLAEVREEDSRAFELFREEVARSGLPMRCIDAERQFDGNRITFYFVAEARVDFRALVRELARIFHTRIELRQISSRESARRQEGLGPCGRPLCCASYLQGIETTRVRQARMQVPNQTTQRVTGICGRLLCCLAYEENGEAEEGGPQ